MSAVCIFTPMVMELAWPALAQAIGASLAAAGYQAVKATGAAAKQRASSDGKAERAVEFDAASGGEFAEGLGEDEELRFEKDGITFVFRRSPEGKLRVCACGRGASERELTEAAQRALNAFLQDYVRRRVTAELRKRGYALEEERLADGTVRVKARDFR